MAVATISEYSASINTPQMVKAPILAGGKPVQKNGRQIKYAGGFCVVFPYETPRKKYAVRCWHINIADIQKRTRIISEAIHASKLLYFVGFDYIPNGLQTAQGAQDIVVMDWVNAQTLKRYIADHINQPAKLIELANRFKTMVADLHSHNFAHGDLQHGNIMVKDDGSLVLVDYDSMYVPALDGYSDVIKGLAGYQHPARWKNCSVNEKIDYFSELIIYTSIVALSKFPHLWKELNLEDTETMLFSPEDISSKGSSRIFYLLDKDAELKNLSSRIKEYLRKDNITDIEPLEEAIKDPVQSVVEGMSGKWRDSGYQSPKAQTADDFEEIAKDISGRW